MESRLAESCQEMASPLFGSTKPEQKQGLLAEGATIPSASGGKRKLPAWQSSSTKSKQPKNCKDEDLKHAHLSKDETINTGSMSKRPDQKNGQRAPGKTHTEKRPQDLERARPVHKTPPSKDQTRVVAPRIERNSKDFKVVLEVKDIDKAEYGNDEEDEPSHMKKLSGAPDASMKTGGRLGGVGTFPEKVRESSRRIDTQVATSGSNIGQPSAQSKEVMNQEVSKNGVNMSGLALDAPQRKAAIKSKCIDFSKFLDGVVFAISGLVNPERADVRDKALQMGAQYRPDWGPNCTLLVCAYANTPKFNQVKGDNGTIVSKDWILKCHEQRKLLEIDSYLMHPGKPWRLPGASDDGVSVQREDKKSEVIVASLSTVRRWACEDVESSIAWLQRQERQPEASELKKVAIEGIRLCLDDVVECIRKRQSMKDVLDTWEFLPRAVRELAAARQDSETHDDFLPEAERLKWIYTDELKKLEGEGLSKGVREDPDGNCTSDNDATEIMPGDDEEGPDDVQDSSSETTQVLDDNAIQEAQEVISKITR